MFHAPPLRILLVELLVFLCSTKRKDKSTHNTCLVYFSQRIPYCCSSSSSTCSSSRTCSTCSPRQVRSICNTLFACLCISFPFSHKLNHAAHPTTIVSCVPSPTSPVASPVRRMNMMNMMGMMMMKRGNMPSPSVGAAVPPPPKGSSKGSSKGGGSPSVVSVPVAAVDKVNNMGMMDKRRQLRPI